MSTFYLVRPWLDAPLEREDKSGVVGEGDPTLPHSPSTDGHMYEINDGDDEGDEEMPDEEVNDNETWSLSRLGLSLHPALARTVPMDRGMCARRPVARLGRLFDALLLTPASTGGCTTDYGRVAADGLITVRFREDVSLAGVLNNVRTLDVL